MSTALDSAVHQNVDPVTDGIDDFSQLIEWCARAVQLPAAMIGYHDPGATDLGCALGVCYRHHALETKLAVPSAHHFGHVVPAHGRVEHIGEIATDRHGATAHVHVLVELRQLEAFMRDVVDAPHRFDRELEHAAQRQPERNGKA